MLFFWSMLIDIGLKPLSLIGNCDSKVCLLIIARNLLSLVSHNCSFCPLPPCEKIGISRPVSAGFICRSMVRSFPLKLRFASVSMLACPLNCTLTISERSPLFTSPFTSKLLVPLRLLYSISSEKLNTIFSPWCSNPLFGSGVPNSCGRRVSLIPLITFDGVVRNVPPLRQKSTALRS